MAASTAIAANDRGLPTAAISMALDHAGVDTTTLLKDVVTNCAANPAHPLNALVHEQVQKNLNAQLTKRGKRHVVKQSLTADLERELQRVYPGFNLVFAREIYTPHPYAAASRELEVELLLNQLGYDDLASTATDVYIKDVGGNPARYLTRRNIHCCSPTLCARDVSRLHAAHDAAARQHVELDERRLCRRRGQHCPVTAIYNMYIHSTYDMTCEDIADSMIASQAVKGVGTYIFHPSMCFMDYGRIPVLGCSFFMNARANTIRFTFYDDQDYVHDLKEYKRFVCSSVIRTTDGSAAYLIHRRANCNGVQFFELVPTALTTPEVCSFSLTPYLDTQFYIVSSFRLCLDTASDVPWLGSGVAPWRSSEDSIFHLKRIQILVPKDWFDRVRKYADQQKEGGFTLTAVQSYARAQEARIIINGKEVQGLKDKLDPDTLSNAAVAAYLMAFRSRYEATQTVRLVTLHEKTRRVRRYKPAFYKSLMRAVLKCSPKCFHSQDLPTLQEATTLAYTDYEYIHGVNLVSAELTLEQHLNQTSDPLQFAHSWTIPYGGIDQTLAHVYPGSNSSSDTIIQDAVSDQTSSALLRGKRFTASVESITRTTGADEHDLQVPGDGKCAFHAFRLATGVSYTTDELINIVRPDVDVTDIPSMLPREQWGGKDELARLATYFQLKLTISFAFQLEDGRPGFCDEENYCPSGYVGLRKGKLRFMDNHYKAVLSTGSVKSVVVEPGDSTILPDPNTLWFVRATCAPWEYSTSKKKKVPTATLR